MIISFYRDKGKFKGRLVLLKPDKSHLMTLTLKNKHSTTEMARKEAEKIGNFIKNIGILSLLQLYYKS